MPNNWNIEIKHYNVNTATITDITENFVSLPLATDTGTEEVNNARLVLSASSGKFIVSAPLLNQFDRIRIKITDDEGNIYNKIFDIIKIIPSWTKSEGVRVTLILFGMEHWLQKINHIKPFFYEGAYEVIKDVGDSYNNSRGTLQPALTGYNDTTKNKLPSANFQKNNYDFAVSEAPCMDRITDVIDKLGASVDDGGALDYYETKFNNSISDYTTLELNAFSSGSPTSGSEITLSESSSVNVGETDSGIDSITGTIVNAWGAVDQGSLPTDFSQFKSAERRFNFYPNWSSTENYKINSKVRYLGVLYYAIQNSLNKIPSSQPSYWTAKTKAQNYGNIYFYSPWTKGVDAYWKDSGIDPSNINSSGEIGRGFFDGNFIVNDTANNWYRTWVDIRLSTTNPKPSDITSDVTLQKYLYNNTNFYRGFRVLIQKTTTSTAWSPSGTSLVDTNNKSYGKAIVEYTGTEWRVVYESVTDNLICNVRHEGISYRYSTGTGLWTALGMDIYGDCFHPWDSLSNDSGVPGIGDGSTQSDGSIFTANSNSAIKVQYNFNSHAILNSSTDQHQLGAWLNFMFPFPTAKINHSTTVGTLYGGGVSGRDSICEPATLDIQNMHLTHDGFRGFNAQDDSSEDFGQISSIDFWMKMDYQDALTTDYASVKEGNFIMTCLMVDTSDNIVSQDFTIQFNNHWDEYKLPVSGFTIQRAKMPILGSFFAANTPPKQFDVSNIFNWRNIKMIIWQTKESYDNDGRYSKDSNANRYITDTKDPILGIPLIRYNRRIDLWIDALHFTKPLLVNTGNVTDRCIESEFIERPEIMDYFQLKNDAKAELEKRKFRHVEFDISTTGKCNVNFGDFFLFENSKLIPDEFETSTGSNKIKLVAKHIEYSITKPVDGKGGFLRRILGVKRFE